MTKDEILGIIAKYRRMSNQELKYGADKCALFDRIADQLEDDIEMYVDDDYFQSEREIIEDITGLFDEHDKYFGEEETDSTMVNLMGTILCGINSGESDELIAVKAIAELLLSGYALDENSIKEMSKNTREKCQKHLFALQIAIDTIQDYHCSAEEALSQIANIL